MPIQIERSNQIPVYKMQDVKRKQVFVKGKILIEGQVEKKINGFQWKNIILTLKENNLMWEFVDTEEFQQIEIKQIKSIEQSNRVFTITVSDEKVELQQFRTSSIQETDNWVCKLSDITDIEISMKIVQRTQTLQNYQQNSLTQIQKTPSQEQVIKKPSFFEQLFCWGSERNEIKK